MGYIELNPGQTVFSTPTIVQASQDPRVVSVVYTEDGSPPTLAKHLAYDTLTPSNPFISVVQDGKGNALFDGGFPKWYNTYWADAWQTYQELTATYKYFANALEFIRNPLKPKKILFIGDARQNATGTYPSYHIQDIAGSGFNKSITGICRVMGYEYEIVVPPQAGGMMELDYSYLDQFAGVVFFGTVHTATEQRISNATFSNITLYRESGNGVFIITDHGTEDGASGFFYNSNLLARQLGVEFRGTYNRSPVNVGHLRRTYGDHVLWSGMTDDEYVQAGGSESKVELTERQGVSHAPDVFIDKQGWTILRYLVVLDNGRAILENYSYGMGITDFITITPAPPTVLNNEKLQYDISYPEGSNYDSISGVVRHDSDVRGYFSRTPSLMTKTWSTSDKDTVYPLEGDLVEVVVTSPISYFKSERTGRVQPDASPLSLARLVKGVRILELNKHTIRNLLREYHETLKTPNAIGAGRRAKLLRNYIQN